MQRAQCQKPWLILIDMDADSNLFPNSIWDLHEMEAAVKTKLGEHFSDEMKRRGQRVGSSENLDIVVQWHLPGGAGTRRLHIWESRVQGFEANWGASQFEARGAGFVQSPVLSEHNSLPVGSRALRVSEFLDWGIRSYPSDHVMVIFWGHHEGWDGVRSKEIQSALRHYRESSSFRKLDVLAMDSCHSNGVELATEFAAVADYYFAPTGVQTSLGLPYRRLLKELHSSSLAGYGRPGDPQSMTALLVAAALPRIQSASLRGRSLPRRFDPVSARHFASSSWDLKSVTEKVQPAWVKLSRGLRDWMQQEPYVRLAWDAAGFSSNRAYSGTGSSLVWIKNFQMELRALKDELQDDRAFAQTQEDLSLLEQAILAARISAAQAENVPEASLGFWVPLYSEVDSSDWEYFQNFAFSREAIDWVEILKSLF